MQPVLLTDNLTKRYGNNTAVDRIRLRIEEGEVYGFLGPNGAGKTTTLKMLVGLIQPTEGPLPSSAEPSPNTGAGY